jgi:hypothetical protein
LGTSVELELVRKRGLFRVLVNGQTAFIRRGGLIAKLLGKPWPSPEEILAAVKSAGA